MSWFFGDDDEKKTGEGKSPVGPHKKGTSPQDKVDECVAKIKNEETDWEDCVEEEDGWLVWESTAKKICDEKFKKVCEAHVDGLRESARKKGKKLDELDVEKEKQSEQNFLLQNLESISEEISYQMDRFPNLMLIEGAEGNLVNIMTCSRRLQPMLDATPLELSNLMPSVRIFLRHNIAGAEAETGRKWEKGECEEFRFTDALRPEDILTGQAPGGAGVGLKSFEWKTTGTDPFTAPRTLMATLTLHFQSMSDLIESSARGWGETGPRWYDLMIQRGGELPTAGSCADNKPANQVNDDEETDSEGEKVKDFSILVEVGYQYPVNNLLTEELKEAVQKSRVVLALNVRSHNFSFRENGTIDLKIDYMARYEGLMDTFATDVFNISADEKNPTAKLIKQLQKKNVRLEKSISSPTGLSCAIRAAKKGNRDVTNLEKELKQQQEFIQKTQEKIDKNKNKLRLSNYGRFIQNCVRNGRLHSMTVSDKQWKESRLPKTYTVGSVAADAAAAARSAHDALPSGDSGVNNADFASGVNTKLFGKKPVKRGYKRIYYFFLGDLINFISRALPDNAANDGEKETAEKFEIVLGDIEFLDYKMVKEEAKKLGTPDQLTDEQVAHIVQMARKNKNLAYIPISLDFYSMWFSKNVINGRTQWSFHNYLNKMISELVVGSLQASTSSELGTGVQRLFNERNRVRRAIVVGQNNYMIRGLPTLNPMRVGPNDENVIWIDRSIAPICGDQDAPMTQYLIISASKLPQSSTEIDAAKNREEGIYHLYIGTDAGIVKGIDFARVSKPEIRDWNMMRAYNSGDAGVGAILEPYNATVRLFGSGFFQPGQYVYLNPATIGKGDFLQRLRLARKLGLGGFYLIGSVSTVIEAGKLETTLDCKFEYYGNLPGPKPPEATTNSALDQTIQEYRRYLLGRGIPDIELPPLSTSSLAALYQAQYQGNTRAVNPSVEEETATLEDADAATAAQIDSDNAGAQEGQQVEEEDLE